MRNKNIGRSILAIKLCECVWPFCGVGALRVKPRHIVSWNLKKLKFAHVIFHDQFWIKMPQSLLDILFQKMNKSIIYPFPLNNIKVGHSRSLYLKMSRLGSKIGYTIHAKFFSFFFLFRPPITDHLFNVVSYLSLNNGSSV